MTDIAGLAAADPGDVFALLGSSAEGLDAPEALRRFDDAGPNEVSRRRRGSGVRLFLRNFSHLLAILLWVAAALSFAAGLAELGIAILAVLVVNGVFAFAQESHADRLIEALEATVPRTANVWRGGVEHVLPARELVPGDLVGLVAGDRVPADARLIEGVAVQVDDSALTGESEPRYRDPAASPAAQAIDAPNLLLAGSVLVGGEGRAVVYATGPRTELGRVASRAAGLSAVQSPLERQIARVARTVAVIATGVGLGTMTLAVSLGGRSFEDALVFGVGVIVALTPEGLLPTVSLSLALGVTRIAERGGVVRRLSAVEALGAATVICTDKTGTLTENRMSCVSYWTPEMGHAEAIGVRAPAYERLARAALFASGPSGDGDAALFGDPIDVALRAMGDGQLPAARPSASFPFDPELRRTTLVWHDSDGSQLVACKGAPESVLPLTRLAGDAREADAVLAAMANEGLRVIAVAERRVATGTALGGRDGVERELTLVGLVGLLDPPRAGVPEALERCQRAGIRVIVMSGDFAATAQAVARRVGIRESGVYTGQQLREMGDAAVRQALSGSVVLARVTPEDKLHVVETLQAMGEIVAVTGDGVNDAPALRRADVGVAMGARGTEAARQAADIILTDDNFTTIVDAIEEGRGVFLNIRKFAAYVFTSNVAELAPFVAFILLDLPLAIPVLLVLAIDLGTDLLPALALGAEPPEPGLMDRPPRNPSEPILSRAVLLRALLFLGGIEAALGMAFFFLRYAIDGWAPGEALAASGALYESAKAAAFLGIVGGQVGALFACRSERVFGVTLNPLRNRWILAGLASEVVIAGAIVFVPPVSDLFDVRNPGWIALLAPVAAVLMLLLDDARKLVSGRQRDRILRPSPR